jgi:hypothetical protein
MEFEIFHSDLDSTMQFIFHIQLQFTIKVIDDPDSCVDTEMKFVFPTVVDGYRISYPGFPIVGYFQNGVYLESVTSK